MFLLFFSCRDQLRKKDLSLKYKSIGLISYQSDKDEQINLKDNDIELKN